MLIYILINNKWMPAKFVEEFNDGVWVTIRLTESGSVVDFWAPFRDVRLPF
jgi:hypothetical protein